LLAELKKIASGRLRDFASRHFAALPAQTILQEGSPAAVITACARQRKPRMIMMPTHGYGPFRRFLTGSVTARVLHDAACPVWTAAHADTTPIRLKPPSRILCGVDRTAAAVSLIRWAARFATECGASLQLVHVMQAVDENSQNRGEKAVRRFCTAKARQELAPLLEAAGQTEILLHGGAIAGSLAKTAAQENADLLVIGRGHLKKSLGRLRTHSMAIVCKSPCPVISV
jgi:nucleotide-binding universal stress UspA family protein